MTWTPLAPAVGNQPFPVGISCSERSPLSSQRLYITARPAMLDGGMAFWVPGTVVTVAVGAGEHAGLLRVAAGPGAYRISLMPGRNGGGFARLVLPPVPGLSPERHRMQPVEYDWSDTWLEITLPAWARPQPAGEISPAAKPAQSTDVARGTTRAGEISPAARAAVRVAPGTPLPSKANPFAVPARMAKIND